MDGKSTISSVKSGAFKGKGSEFSIQTIVQKIDKDMAEIIADVPSRIHKQKLQGVNDTLKILYKKVNTMSSTNSPIGKIGSGSIGGGGLGGGHHSPDFDVTTSIKENEKLKEEIENIKTNYESEIKKLVEEHGSVTSDQDHKEKNLNSQIESLDKALLEEKNSNQSLVKQVKTLEDTLKTVNSEYRLVKERFDKINSEEQLLENQHNDLKRIYNEAKNKINDLKKVNSELKSKIIEGENTLRLHTDDFKIVIRKHLNLQKKFENNEKEKEKMFQDLCYKEERLKALRYMNGKLEHKSKEILEKWAEVKDFQLKSNEIREENKQMLDIIEKLKTENLDINEENQKLKESVENLNLENKEYNSNNINEYVKTEEDYGKAKDSSKIIKKLNTFDSTANNINNAINLNSNTVKPINTNDNKNKNAKKEKVVS